MNNFIVHHGNLVLQKLLIGSASTIKAELSQVASFKAQLLYLYKRFYKLRNVIDNGKPQSVEVFKRVLKRKFKHTDYNRTRQVVLNLPPLTEDEIIERLFNSLIFTFNSTVTSQDEFKPIETFDDINKYDNSKLEKTVITTILRMDQQLPNEIKYDFKYNWYLDLSHNLLQVEALNNQTDTKSKKKKIKSKYPMNYIGFLQYQQTLMGMNETLQMCF